MTMLAVTTVPAAGVIRYEYDTTVVEGCWLESILQTGVIGRIGRRTTEGGCRSAAGSTITLAISVMVPSEQL